MPLSTRLLSITLAVFPTLLAAEAPAKNLPQTILRYFHHGTEQTVRSIAQMMLQVDADGTISKETLATYEQAVLAKERARKMMVFLQMDLDFDGLLTAEEMRSSSLPVSGRNPTDRVDIELLRIDADTNGDGALSLDEIRQSVVDKTQQVDPRNNRSQVFHDLLYLDTDGDDVLTIEEMVRAVKAIKDPE